MLREEESCTSMTFQTKCDVLRSCELYCYQFSFYLLQNEELALRTAKKALIELFRNEDYLLSPESLLKEKVKSVTMKCALSERIVLMAGSTVRQ